MGMKQQSSISELKNLITEMNRTHMSLGENSNEMITLFVSFDIVNSTQYKSQDKAGWSAHMSEIMRRIISQFSNSPTGGYDFWKTLGDEIIYNKKIGTVLDLLNTLDEIYSSLVSLNKQIGRGEFIDGFSSQILSIKAAVWIADLSSSQEKTDNILTYYQINDKRRQADYIGPDIDTGFRIAKYSMSNRMVISFEIACLLMRYEKLLTFGDKMKDFGMSERIKLLSHRELKGVWDGNAYPILIYHGDPSVSFEDSISELEKAKFPIINDYLNSLATSESELSPNYSSYQHQVLENLCEDFGLDSKIQRLIDLMLRTGSVSNQDVKELQLVNYSAVCYFMADNELSFMIVKDPKTAKWGFGNAEFFYSDGFVGQIEKAYFDKFAVNISIQNDKNYLGRIPVVVSSTEFSQDHSTYHSSAVMLGRLEKCPSSEETQELRMISEAEVESFGDDCVPQFREVLYKCSAKIHELEWAKNAKRI